MPKYRPLLGTTTDPNAAFPGIRSLSVKVAQDPHGMYCKEPWQRESTYSKANIPRYERCRNPRCQQGGVDLQQIVSLNGEGEHKFYCNGHEGSPKGRRKGDPCDNSFTVTVSQSKKNRLTFPARKAKTLPVHANVLDDVITCVLRNTRI